MTDADVLIIGAGLSGLTAAFTLHRAGLKVCVLEAGEQAGGLIRSVSEAGFLSEAGPHTFPHTATDFIALCRDLGLTPTPTNALANKRYLYLKSRLTALPSRPQDALRTTLLSPREKWRILKEPFISKTQAADISIADFFRTRLGDAVTERLVDPFISGIYAGDIQRLSLPAVFPKIWEWEQRTGSILKGAWQAQRAKRNTGKPTTPMQLFSFEKGLQTLTDTIVKVLPRDTVRLHCSIEAIQPEAKGYTAHTAAGDRFSGTHLILAVPAYVAARFLQPLMPLAAEALAGIPYSGLASVQTGFLKPDIPHPLDGFGFLVPHRENLPLLGTIWASSLFPDRVSEHYTLLSSYIGGAHRPDIVRWEPERILAEVLENLAVVFKTAAPLRPVFSKVRRYEKAIPQYTMGHQIRIQTIEWALQQHPALSLCGNYLHGVALNECVRSGLQAAQKCLTHLDKKALPY
jgi:oxygen-dependent protoporphyrinogen oxidase